MSQPKTRSSLRQITASSRWLMVIMMVPVVLSLTIMIFFATQYQHSVSRMETIASLKPMVDTEITEKLWSTVSGRKTFAECGVYDTVETINQTLNGLIARTSAGSQLELVVAAAFLLTSRMQRKTRRSISEPIEHLEHFAGLLANGHLQNRIPHTDVEELRALTDRVNVMANNLEALMDQRRQEQENLKKSELRLLQAQINPHFLYNTLDAIIWQAEAGRSDEVIALTRSMSDFFRIALSSGEDWIPMQQEMKHLAGYLSIQKTRYRDILIYEIDVEPDIGEIYILKLLLQPLVENALYHGNKFKRDGCITVTGRREGDWLSFCVRDTGKGMTAQRLNDVKAHMRGRKPLASAEKMSAGSGFGLSNVDQRIRLYYNQEEGVEIQSDATGTTVSFRVPVRGKEENADD